MTDDKAIVRGHSQDRLTYRHPTIAMVKKKTSMELYRQSADYYSNRNCPEILSLFALQQKHLEEREKRIYQSSSNDEHYFNMINYSLQSPSPTSQSSLSFENPNSNNNKRAVFPQVQPRQSSNLVSSIEENRRMSKVSSKFLSNTKKTQNQFQTTSFYSPRKFPTLTPQNNSNFTEKGTVSNYRTTMKSIPSPTPRFTSHIRRT